MHAKFCQRCCYFFALFCCRFSVRFDIPIHLNIEENAWPLRRSGHDFQMYVNIFISTVTHRQNTVYKLATPGCTLSSLRHELELQPAVAISSISVRAGADTADAALCSHIREGWCDLSPARPGQLTDGPVLSYPRRRSWAVSWAAVTPL